MLCEKTGVVALAQLALMAGSQADEMLLSLEIFKIIYSMKHWNLEAFRKVQCHYSDTNTFKIVFHVICILTSVLEVRKLWLPLFFGSIPTIKYYRS